MGGKYNLIIDLPALQIVRITRFCTISIFITATRSTTRDNYNTISILKMNTENWTVHTKEAAFSKFLIFFVLSTQACVTVWAEIVLKVPVQSYLATVHSNCKSRNFVSSSTLLWAQHLPIRASIFIVTSLPSEKPRENSKTKLTLQTVAALVHSTYN